MKFIAPEVEQYCISKSTVPSSACRAIEEFTKKNVPYPQMLVGPMEGSLLGFLISLTQAQHILEIGTYTGYSALAMAERLPESGTVTTLDINEETSKVAHGHWDLSPHGKKIRSFISPALSTLIQLENEKKKFDLVFIDADKVNYFNYLQHALRLTHAHGLIVADNCLWSGHVLNPERHDPDTTAIRQLNDFVSQSPDLEKVLLPVRDGLFLIRKK